MSLATQATASTDPAFVALVQQAVIAAAIAISNESVGTVNHANRVALARQVAQSSFNLAPQFAVGVASQGFDKTSTDTAISNSVSAIWNTYAGMP